MNPQIKIVSSIIIIGILLIIMLLIECGYIQYGFGKTNFKHPIDFQRNLKVGVCAKQ